MVVLTPRSVRRRWAVRARPRGTRDARAELRGPASARRRVPVMQDQRVAVRVGEERLEADARVDGVPEERHALGLELLAARGDVVDAQRHRRAALAELAAERLGLHEREREVPGLVLGAWHLAPALGEGQAEQPAVEG